MEKLNQSILEYGYVPDQVTIEFSHYCYNIQDIESSILYPVSSTLYDHFTTTMVDISTSGVWVLIFDPYEAKPSICADSCFSSSEKKPLLCWLPLEENQTSKS